MSKITIKSYKGNYEVFFMNDIPTKEKLVQYKFIVIDNNVNDIYFNIEDNIYLIDSSEETKTLEGVSQLIKWLMSNGFKKNDTICAIGGGVVQDLVSFTASILYRGVDWVFYPTTLLAQCDSCIGSKTSINHNDAKNILGGFHPPEFIGVSNKFLDSLPESEIKSGIGEMLHYFLLNNELKLSQKMVKDENIRFNINKYTEISLNIKKQMIEKDEFDKGERNLFNLGHTFGHALEKITNYEINHGQAVTWGMIVANLISFKQELISKQKYNKLNKILIKNAPVVHIKNAHVFVDVLKKDKKNVSDNLTCILFNESYGIKAEVPYSEVIESIQEVLDR